MNANVYVDAFNLYYRAVRGTPWRWLDLEALALCLLDSRFTLHRIRYFTAPVKPRQSDPDGYRRQQVYLRALRTIPELVVHEGHFLTNATRLPLANPPPGGPGYARVVRTEEKGSDANLAAYLTRDDAKRDAQAAFVVSGDSDFAGVIRMVRRDFNFPVHVVDPAGNRSRHLRSAATKYHPLDHALLPQCQFPTKLTDRTGIITRPPSWE